MRAALLAFFLIASCGDDDDSEDCACTITIGDVTQNLSCGQQTCISGSSYGCEEDAVENLGVCFVPDASGCIAVQAACTPGANNCCVEITDASMQIVPVCDPVSQRCCVASFAPCSTSGDCCGGRACIAGASGFVCAS